MCIRDRDRNGEPFLQRDLGGAQHALVLALGIDHALGIGLRLLEQRLHQEAGAEDEARELLAIGLDIDQLSLIHI